MHGRAARLFGSILIGAAMLPHSVSANHYHETVLNSFGGANGAGALYGVIADAAGNLYGATAFGGTAGFGAVFELSPGKEGYSETLLYSFPGNSSDGYTPGGGLITDANGDLYGVTVQGGTGGCGTVYRLAPAKNGYTESVLYAFQCNGDGSQPIGAPVIDRNGVIYGVTQFTSGFDGGYGVVFALTPSKSSYTQSVLYTFPGGTGGEIPQAGLTIDRHGNLFGTTYYGGVTSACEDAGCGTVFELEPSKSGYTESIVYDFDDVGGNDGDNPFAALAVDDVTGAIFGTTQYGGAHFDGTVFELMPSGGTYTESLLYSFTAQKDGFLPESQLLIGPKQTLFGTVTLGGGGCSGIGCGTVYQLTRSHGGYKFGTIYNFHSPAHGAEPEFSSLVMDSSSALYGTTRSGGADTSCSDGGPGGAPGCGVVFKLTP